MVDTFALLMAHALLILVVIRLFKVPDPEAPPKKQAVRRLVPGRPDLAIPPAVAARAAKTPPRA